MNNKTQILFVFLFLFSQKMIAQQQRIDSLSVVIKQHIADDSVKVDLLNDIAYEYHLIIPDSTISLAQKAFQLATKIKYKKGIADALKVWSISAYIRSEYDLALAKNHEAIAIYDQIGEQKGKAAVINNIAIIKHNQGEYQAALSYYQQSLAIRQKIGDHKGVAACYNNMGNTYADMGNYSESLFQLYRGLQLREKMNDSVAIANSLANIAYVYYLLGKTDRSLQYSLKAYAITTKLGIHEGSIQAAVSIAGAYQTQQKLQQALYYLGQALSLAKKMNDQFSVALCLSNIGEVYIDMKRYAEAEKCIQQSLTICTEANDEDGIALNNIHLGEIYLNTGLLPKSIEHLQKGLAIASDINQKLRILEASQLLSEAYEKMGDLRNANLYLKKYMASKDSIFNEEVHKKTEEIASDFLLDKKQKEIALLEKDKSIQEGINERTKLISFSMAIGIMLLSLFIVNLLYNKKKVSKANAIAIKQKEEIERQAIKLQELNDLKDRIFSVLAHDLRSPVASLSGIMSLIDQEMATPEDFLKLRSSINNQLSALSALLDNLLNWSKNQIQGNIIFQKETILVHDAIEQNFNLLNVYARQKDITLLNNTNHSDSVFLDVNHFDIIIRNLLSNAIKFTPKLGIVEVSSSSKNDTVEIIIKDSGVGMNPELLQKLFKPSQNSSYGTGGEKGIGIGLLLCKEFVSKNNGTISVTSEIGKGTTFSILLPKA